MNDMFSMLNRDGPPLRSVASDRHQRPVSEMLKRDSFKSPESQVLDQWFEDLQQYESSLESMATASLDPKYKEEVQHVDQWFRYLNEAERTATIYTLLQHSTQVQIRFFMVILQQLSQKDPVSALLSPAHPEKDMQTQLTSAMMVKAELEASQKLASVIPFQTGRPNRIGRHSFALDDDFLPPPPPRPPTATSRYSMFEQKRPKSVIEGDVASLFKNDWSFGLVPPQTVVENPSRPKSADMSHWNASLWTPTLDHHEPWKSNRSSVVLNEEIPSPPVVLSVYNDTTSTLFPVQPQRYGQFLSPGGDENGYFSDHSDQSNGSKNRFMIKTKEKGDVVDMQLLQDVPAWLRSLRLHKYNPIFENYKWQDMLKMDDAALLSKGVAALGARRKLLKVFEQIKAHCQLNSY
ncbi:hypothetical protein INT47_003917 [Mucor saturninus]|uniref:SAM domain-containing protein n=1 Tax=Mucor saturninus TaxID=64648 RepID=A0A8H7UQQ3_9FUNG|nr:hypothetical protein INT47_003917 [Mucor saturninus]